MSAPTSRFWLLFVGVWWLSTTAGAASIARTDDLARDVQRLETLTRGEWLDLTVADLGEAWWLLHEAASLQPQRYAHLTIAVKVAGKVGYINTRRLDGGSGPNTTVPADLFQSFSGGNYSILVSGASPPYRPSNPLGWRGFVWEGLEAPDTRLGRVFDDVAVMPRKRISFVGTTPLRPMGTPQRAAEAAGPVLADAPPGADSRDAPVRQAPAASAIETPRPVAPSNLTEKRSSAAAPLPPMPPVPAVIPRRLESGKGPRRASRLPARLETDARTRHISQVNRTLRRRVAYLEALVLGPDMGRVVELDVTVGELIDVILAGAKTPQRNVFLRIGVGVDSKVGRIVNATRYPLYKVAGAGRGSHTILVDLEVRGPDGRTLLKSASKSASKSDGASVVDGTVQFRQVHVDMKLRDLGITNAVWWPIPAHLK